MMKTVLGGIMVFVSLLAMSSSATMQGEPPPQASSSSSEGLSTWVELADTSWKIQHTRSVDGSLVLFRNRGFDPVSVTIEGTTSRLIEPNQARAWECQTNQLNDTLIAKTEEGEEIYSANVECGDAVVLKTFPPSPDSVGGLVDQCCSCPFWFCGNPV